MFKCKIYYLYILPTLIMITINVSGYSQSSEENINEFTVMLGGDTRNSGFWNVGVGKLWGKNAWIGVGHAQTASILLGYNFKKGLVNIEAEYNYSLLTVFTPSVGLNINSSFNNRDVLFGLKPMLGWDLIIGNINFGYNFILNKNSVDIKSGFSFSALLRISMFVEIFKKK